MRFACQKNGNEVSESPNHIDDRHSRFELKTLLETSRLLIESHDMDFVLNNLLLITMGKLMVTRAMVLIYQPGKENYIVSKAKGRGCPEEGKIIDAKWDEEIREQSVIRCDNADLELPELLQEKRPCTLFNLQTSNNHIGFLWLGSKGNGKPLNEREVEFVESLTIISSVAIANSRMFSELRRINRMLDRKVYELNTLFDLSKDFNMMVDRDQIIRIFKFAMLGQMLIRKFFFVLQHDGKREVAATSGISKKPSKKEINRLFELENDLIEVKENEELQSEVPFLKEQEIVAVIGLRLQNEKIGLVGVGGRANREEYSTSDYNFLRSLGNLALLSIQKTYLLQERIEKERLEEELDIAKNIQRGLLPDPIPDCEQLDIAATNISSYQVGGDYYDILKTPGERLLFAIADVTGKGMPAALLMANLQAMLHVLLPIDITLGEASARVNDIIYENTPPDKFITFFWGLYDPSDASFEYVNAGHNPPILLRSRENKTQLLEEGGLILGAMPTMNPYEEQKITLHPNDVLVFFTDGVTEALNPDETEEYGNERLLEVIKEHRDKSSNAIMKHIVEDVKEYSQNTQHDDITLIVVKVN